MAPTWSLRGNALDFLLARHRGNPDGISAHLHACAQPPQIRGVALFDARPCQYRARDRAVRRARAVRPHYRRLIRRASRRRMASGARARPANRCVGCVRIVHHRRRRAGGVVRRSASAPAPQPRSGGFLRACFAIAARLPRQRSFGSAVENHAHRHRHAVVVVAVVLSRAFRRFCLHRRSAADNAGAQLAARSAAARLVSRFHRADGAGHAQDPIDAARGRTLLFRPCRDRRRHAWQRRRGAELRARRDRSVGAQGHRELAAARAAVVVGGGGRAYAGRNHAQLAHDPAGRNLSQTQRAGFGRRNRQLHGHRRASDSAARAGGRFRQPPVRGRNPNYPNSSM